MLNFFKDVLDAPKKSILVASLMTAALKVCSLAPPILLGNIIDSLTGGKDFQGGLSLLLAFIGVILLHSIVTPLQTYHLTKLVQITLKKRSMDWTKAILGKEFEYFSSLRLGGLIKSVERGINAHEKLLTFLITAGLPLFVEILLVATIFIFLSGSIPFFSLVTASILYLGVCHWLIQWRRPHLVAVNDQEDLVSTKLFDTLQAGKAIKLEGANDRATEPLFTAYGTYADAAIKVASSGAMLASTRIVFIGFSTAGLLAWGIHDQFRVIPMLTVGELVALFSIAGSFLANVSILAESYRTLDQFLIDKQRLDELLDLPDLAACDRSPIDPPFAEIALHSSSTDMLQVHSNESVAIVGPSGAGKTTLLETLAGMVSARRLDMSVDGLPIAPENTAVFLERVRYCPQHPSFLEGTFHHSVLFGQMPSRELEAFIKALDLEDVIKNRTISEGAKNISGGEAKRLALLRLFNRPGHFNLFDEPTASLDSETAILVWGLLFSVFQGKGLICVTHDMTTLARFDRVIVLRDQRIIADGPWCRLKHENIVEAALAINETVSMFDGEAHSIIPPNKY